MDYVAPEYNHNAEYFLRTTANSADELVTLLLDDEGFADNVLELNEQLNESNDGKQLEDAVKELAPVTTAQLIENFQEQQKLWPEETDNVRLTRALKTLEPAVVSFEGNFCCSSCGFYEVNQDQQAGKYPEAEGFIFYNEQSVDRVLHGGPLWISYGSFTEKQDDAADLVVAEKFVNAVKAEGLEVEWDGSLNSGISVVNMFWQRAFPGLMEAGN